MGLFTKQDQNVDRKAISLVLKKIRKKYREPDEILLTHFHTGCSMKKF